MERYTRLSVMTVQSVAKIQSTVSVSVAVLLMVEFALSVPVSVSVYEPVGTSVEVERELDEDSDELDPPQPSVNPTKPSKRTNPSSGPHRDLSRRLPMNRNPASAATLKETAPWRFGPPELLIRAVPLVETNRCLVAFFSAGTVLQADSEVYMVSVVVAVPFAATVAFPMS
jgi:hypothetical protein